jgi:hypothetical protein
MKKAMRIVAGLLCSLFIAEVEAAIAFRAAASAGVRQPTISSQQSLNGASAASGNVTPSLSSVDLNALLLCLVEQHDNVVISFPAGWTQLYSISTTATHRASAFYKIAAATEVNPLITHVGGNTIIAQCATYRGIDSVNPLDAAYAAQYSANSTSVTSGSLATLSASDMMLFAMHIGNNINSPNTPTGTGGVSWSQQVYNSTGLGSHAAIGLYTGSKATAGAVGPIASTISTAAENHGVLIALHNASRLSISVPSGTVPGDVMVAAVATTPSSVPITAPVGWTLIQAVAQSTSTSNRISTYYRVAGAGEPSSYSWTLSTNHTGAAGGIVSFSGVDNSNPVDLAANQLNAASVTQAAPSITPNAANEVLVTVHGFSSSPYNAASPYFGAWQPPSGMTEAVDRPSRSNSSSGIALEMNYLQLGATGIATGIKTATASSNADSGIGISIALRPAVAAPDHIEIDYPAPPFSTCSPTSVTAYACANAACSSYYTRGVNVTLLPGGNVVSIPSGSGSGNGAVFQTIAGAATLDTISTPAATTATICKNTSTSTFNCNVNFSAGSLAVSVPNLGSGNIVTGTISGCAAQFPAGANTINFYTSYQNPSSGTKQVTINGTTVATNSAGTGISLSFNGASPSSSASFNLSYPDVGAVGLTAVTPSASGSASFIAAPHHFVLSGINCAVGCIATSNPGAANAAGGAFMKAGNLFSITVMAYNSANAVTPNFGKEAPAESVDLTPAANMLDLAGAVAGKLTGSLGTFSTGAASGNAFSYDEVGIMTLTPSLHDPDAKGYMSIGSQTLNPVGAVSGNIGRFVPDHFTITADPDSPIVSRADLPQTITTVNAPASVGATTIGVAATTGFNVASKVRIAGAAAAGNVLNATVSAVGASTLKLNEAIGTALLGDGSENVIDDWGSYMGEQFNAQFRLTAVDFNANVTQNYQGPYAKLNPAAAGNPLGFGAVDTVTSTSLTGRLNAGTVATGSFSAGVAVVVAPLVIDRGASPDGPFTSVKIGIAPTTAESDGVRMGVYDLNVGGSNDHKSIMDASVQASTEVRYGRIRLPNVYGSERLPLPMTATAQYYNEANWVTNAADSLTSFNGSLATAVPAGNVFVADVTGLTHCPFASSSAGISPVLAGVGSFILSAPGVSCSANISLNAPTYLPSSVGRATFGIYKSPLIYRRENY